MRDHMSIGSSPCDEPCAQVGQDNYAVQAKQECRRYIELLLKKFGEPPEGASLSVKGFPHDFGTYYEVVVNYDDDDRAGLDYALLLEGNSPATWDDDKPVAPKPKTEKDPGLDPDYCDECGAKYPDNADSLFGPWHGPACSLNPKNMVG